MNDLLFPSASLFFIASLSLSLTDPGYLMTFCSPAPFHAPLVLPLCSQRDPGSLLSPPSSRAFDFPAPALTYHAVRGNGVSGSADISGDLITYSLLSLPHSFISGGADADANADVVDPCQTKRTE